MRCYSELIQLPTFRERLAYLQLFDNNVTSPRHISAQFYQSKTWKTIRKQIIDRDLGFDLGVFGVYIEGGILVHHINPINESDIMYQTKKLLDPENLITLSVVTHNLIHYDKKEKEQWVERKPGDTKLW
jgi:5-methylcytosine-specific restriction endonuclease McrA